MGFDWYVTYESFHTALKLSYSTLQDVSNGTVYTK